MKHLGVLFLVLLLCSSVFASVAVKGGLAGGAFRLGAVLDRPVNDKVSLAGEAGYAVGNYSVMTAGVSAKYFLRENLSAGLGVNYSSYSTAVTNIAGVGNVASGGGVGGEVFAELKLREGILGQLGYDSRLGAVAEISYQIKK